MELYLVFRYWEREVRDINRDVFCHAYVRWCFHWKHRWLGEGIRWLIFGGNVGNIEKPLGNMITNKVNIKGNAFHSGMKYQIDWQMASTNIVTVDGWFVRQWGTKFTYKRESEPIELQQLWRQGHKGLGRSRDNFWYCSAKWNVF